AGLPCSETLLVRRELSPDGRGRVFVEDQPAAVRTLTRLGDRLVSIQGQSSERDLVDADAPLDLLDEFAGASTERGNVADAARAWSAARDALVQLEASRRDRSARLETIEFQIREIEAAAPDEKEAEELSIERDRLLHADRIRLAGETALTALSAKRLEAAPRFSRAVAKELGGLALEKARFRVAVTSMDGDAPRRSGLESAALLFQPNPGEPEMPLDRVASGGELSRLQLAVQSVAAARGGRQRTLVFDEVDSGIGGRTAES